MITGPDKMVWALDAKLSPDLNVFPGHLVEIGIQGDSREPTSCRQTCPSNSCLFCLASEIRGRALAFIDQRICKYIPPVVVLISPLECSE